MTEETNVGTISFAKDRSVITLQVQCTCSDTYLRQGGNVFNSVVWCPECDTHYKLNPEFEELDETEVQEEKEHWLSWQERIVEKFRGAFDKTVGLGDIAVDPEEWR